MLFRSEEGQVNKQLVLDFKQLVKDTYVAMSDDFNTAKAIAALFEMSAKINSIKSGSIAISSLDEPTFHEFKSTYISMMENVLGLKEETELNNSTLTKIMDVIIGLRKKVRADRNYALSDKIRDDLQAAGVQLKEIGRAHV